MSDLKPFDKEAFREQIHAAKARMDRATGHVAAGIAMHPDVFDRLPRGVFDTINDGRHDMFGGLRVEVSTDGIGPGGVVFHPFARGWARRHEEA